VVGPHLEEVLEEDVDFLLGALHFVEVHVEDLAVLHQDVVGVLREELVVEDLARVHVHQFGAQVDLREVLVEEQLEQIEEALHPQNQDRLLAEEDTLHHRRDLLRRQTKRLY